MARLFCAVIIFARDLSYSIECTLPGSALSEFYINYTVWRFKADFLDESSVWKVMKTPVRPFRQFMEMRKARNKNTATPNQSEARLVFWVIQFCLRRSLCFALATKTPKRFNDPSDYYLPSIFAIEMEIEMSSSSSPKNSRKIRPEQCPIMANV